MHLSLRPTITRIGRSNARVTWALAETRALWSILMTGVTIMCVALMLLIARTFLMVETIPAAIAVGGVGAAVIAYPFIAGRVATRREGVRDTLHSLPENLWYPLVGRNPAVADAFLSIVNGNEGFARQFAKDLADLEDSTRYEDEPDVVAARGIIIAYWAPTREVAESVHQRHLSSHLARVAANRSKW